MPRKKAETTEEELDLQFKKLEAEVDLKRAKASQEKRKDRLQDKQLVDINDVRFLIQRSADACRKEVYRIARLAGQINPSKKSCDYCGTMAPYEIEELINKKIDEAFANFQRINLT